MTKYDGLKISCAQSAGINSAAALCYLYKIGAKPKELHLPYFHFIEHSPDSLNFVLAIYAFARIHFENVITYVTNNSVLAFFEEQKMIPHPLASPCSRLLKIEPMIRYNFEHGIDLDLIGYVKKEKKRMAAARENEDMFNVKDFPIELFDDEMCFEIVKECIGWYPKIYDIRNSNGKRIFKHNNCLPCKNMQMDDLLAVQEHYPEYMRNAIATSNKIRSYWGRNGDDYYKTFGREDYEAQQCDTCSFD